jgi:hypothetical protein
MKSRYCFALLAAISLVAVACSTGGAATTTTASSTTTTAAPTTTTVSSTTAATTTSSLTTTANGTLSPINGLPVADAGLLQRRVMAVKVDNHAKARPQSGLQEADAVIEVLVEGGLTRFVALFLQSDSTYLGPVRSVRPTDSAMVATLGAPLVFSGGQEWIRELATSRGVHLMTEGVGGLFRVSHRAAPHNLYADTTELRASADALGLADAMAGPLYAVGPWTAPATPADTVKLDWASGHTVTWVYQDGKYQRFEGTSAHDWVDKDGNTSQLAFDVLVVIVADEFLAGPPSGQSGSQVPAARTAGEGNLLVFAEGKVLQGTWSREEIDQPFTFVDSDGKPLVIPPGVPWISVFPNGRTINWS